MDKDNLEAIEQAVIYPEFPQELGLQRYIPQKERDSYDAADFAGPDRSFPITSQAQLDAAAKLIGHAADPAAVKRKAIAIAKRKGFKLPDSWQEDGDKKDDKEERLQVPEHPFIYAPIRSIDNQKWEIEGVATSEAVDSYGTIFSYEASKKAFQKWIERTANVREMHDKKAVGKGIGVQFDDVNKQVIVRSRVSRAAQDTWTKIQEGVLTGYSVGAGANHKWGRTERNGKSYPYLIEYDLAELSIVDNASNPDGHGLAICRANGINEEIVDITEPETPPEQTQETPQAIATPEEERAGKTISAPSQASTHAAIGHALKGAKALMDMCAAGSGCENCAKASKAIDPDNDGDVDWLGLNDSDNDDGNMEERMQAILERSQSPILQRHNAILARYAQFDTEYAEIKEQLEEIKTFKEQLQQLNEIKTVLERVASSTTLDEVRASVETVRDQVERIAKTPMPGGPIQNGARPYEKTNPYQPETPMTDRAQVERETLLRLNAMGAFQTSEDQTAAAALMLRPMQGMR